MKKTEVKKEEGKMTVNEYRQEILRREGFAGLYEFDALGVMFVDWN